MPFKSAIVLSIVLFLSACASPPRVDHPVDVQAHQQKLAQLVNWKIKGRLAFKSEQEKFSAYLNWQQLQDSFSVKLSSTLGITLLRMQSNAQGASLEADDQEYEGRDATQLVKRVTGWNIPISRLPGWIKGQVATTDLVSWNENGLVEQLIPGCTDCGQWQVTFSRYKKQRGLWLPHQIKLQNQTQTSNVITIRVSSWQPV